MIIKSRFIKVSLTTLFVLSIAALFSPSARAEGSAKKAEAKKSDTVGSANKATDGKSAAGPNAITPKAKTTLFNGKNLDNWTSDLKNDAKLGDVFSVEDGIIKCKGKPVGVLRTKENYTNYKLTVEWRFPGKGGNNGVLVHCSKPKRLNIWPQSMECQLASKNAGDFWRIGLTIDVDPKQTTKGRRTMNLTDDSEKPLGEWNTMEIVCDGSDITVHVNGDLVNKGTNCSAKSGAICLQSEGTPIEFRKVEIEPLKK